MDFKYLSKVTWLCTVWFIVISCGQGTNSQGDTPTTKGEKRAIATTDSIVFKTSTDEYIYLGERLYPSVGVDSASRRITRDLVSIERVGDTLFAFLNTEMLYGSGNSYLPYANDSLLKYHYPKYYKVKIEDDVPYLAYLQNDSDSIQFSRDKDGTFSLDAAVIKDSVISVLGGVRVGLDKESFFSVLGFPSRLIPSPSFVVILCHASVPYDIWFNQGNEDRFPADRPTLQVLFQFEGDELKLIHVDHWIVYGLQ